MPFVPFLVFAAVNKKVVDWFKEILPNDLENKVIQLISWGTAIALALLFAISDFGESIEVLPGKTLDSLNIWSQLIYGLAVGSGAGILNDAIERRNPDANPDGEGKVTT